jgi:general secretion pathway protein K
MRRATRVVQVALAGLSKWMRLASRECGKVKQKSVFMPRPEYKNAPSAGGFIIVAVLWILAALAALVSVYAVYVANTVVAARVYDSRLQTEALITAGLELTAYRLMGFEDASRPTSGAFDFQLGRSLVGVAFRSEGARIDLNFAPKALLSGLCVVLGVKPEDADFYADRIIAWREKPGPGNQNPEAEAYKSAGLNYGPRQAPFQNVAELRLVRRLPADLVDAALPFVTVFNGRPEIDVNEAAPEVVAALPQMNPNLVEAILKRRDPHNPQAVLSLLGAASSSVAVGGRKATRAAVHITLDTGRQVNADVVLLMTENNSAEPYRVLAWHDDFDGPV